MSTPTKFDLDAGEEAMRAYCAAKGKNFDVICAEAGKQFVGKMRVPRTKPLTEEELDALVEDDIRAFPNGASF